MVGVAVNVTEVPEQMVVAVAEMLTDGVTEELTVIAMVFDVAIVVLTQVELLVSTQLTICPLVNEVVVNVELLVPAFVPFTNH